MNIITEHPTPAAIEGQKLKWKPNIGKNWSACFPFLSGACSKLVYWKDWWQHGDCGTSLGSLCNALKWLGSVGHLCWSRLFVLQSGAAPGALLLMMMGSRAPIDGPALRCLAKSCRDCLLHMWWLEFNYTSHWFSVTTSRNCLPGFQVHKKGPASPFWILLSPCSCATWKILQTLYLQLSVREQSFKVSTNNEKISSIWDWTYSKMEEKL